MLYLSGSSGREKTKMARERLNFSAFKTRQKRAGAFWKRQTKIPLRYASGTIAEHKRKSEAEFRRRRLRLEIQSANARAVLIYRLRIMAGKRGGTGTRKIKKRRIQIEKRKLDRYAEPWREDGAKGHAGKLIFSRLGSPAGPKPRPERHGGHC